MTDDEFPTREKEEEKGKEREREREVINYYPASACGLISGFVVRRHVECQEDVDGEKL